MDGIEEASRECQEGSGTGPTMTILVIDDIPALLDMFQEGLGCLGPNVVTAASGQEGLEILRNTHVDAVVCDIGMPEINGWEVGRQIKRICEERGTAKTPLVLVSGWGDQEEDPTLLSKCGVDMVLEKPVSVLKILEVIERLVSELRTEERTGNKYDT